jgi:hypothetical protein
MKIRKIRALTEVQYDLDDGEAFYERLSPGLGQYFRNSLLADLQSLWLYAGIHSKQFGYYRMHASRFPYAIYYDIKIENAIIVAVLDMRQNPSKTATKLSSRK